MGTLAELKPGQTALVTDLTVEDPLFTRLSDLGLVPGTKVRCRLIAPSGSPMAFLIRGTQIALRAQNAAQILCKEETNFG